MFTETSFRPVQFTEGKDLYLSCSVTSGSYSTITLSKVNIDSVEVMAVFNSDGTTKVMTARNSSTERHQNLGLTLMALTLVKAGCEDIGIYRCSHDNGQMSEGRVEISSKFYVGQSFKT